MDSTDRSTDPILRAQAVIDALSELAAAQLGHGSSDVISEGLFHEPDGTVRFDVRVRSADGTVIQHLDPRVFAAPDDSDEQLLDRLQSNLDIDRTDLVRRLAATGAIDPSVDPSFLFTL